MANGIDERAFNAMAEASDEGNIFGGEFGSIVEEIYGEMPVLKKYDFQVGRSERTSDIGQSEYYHAETEDLSPSPSRNYIEILAGATRDPVQLKKMIWGEMLHALGADDKQWQQMRKEYMQERNTSDIALDARTWKESGEERSYPDWMEQSRADAYIRGSLWGDEEWTKMQHPPQREIIGRMSRYLKR